MSLVRALQEEHDVVQSARDAQINRRTRYTKSQAEATAAESELMRLQSSQDAELLSALRAYREWVTGKLLWLSWLLDARDAVANQSPTRLLSFLEAPPEQQQWYDDDDDFAADCGEAFALPPEAERLWATVQVQVHELERHARAVQSVHAVGVADDLNRLIHELKKKYGAESNEC